MFRKQNADNCAFDSRWMQFEVFMSCLKIVAGKKFFESVGPQAYVYKNAENSILTELKCDTMKAEREATQWRKLVRIIKDRSRAAWPLIYSKWDYKDRMTDAEVRSKLPSLSERCDDVENKESVS